MLDLKILNWMRSGRMIDIWEEMRKVIIKKLKVYWLRKVMLGEKKKQKD